MAASSFQHEQQSYYTLTQTLISCNSNVVSYLFNDKLKLSKMNRYMNDNPKNNILLSENIRQKKTNNSGIFRCISIPELLVFFCLIFCDNKMVFYGLSFILCVLQLSGRNGFCNDVSYIKLHGSSTSIEVNKTVFVFQLCQEEKFS